ncbi:MAG: XdhC family protein [Salinivirgaceae bacterium]|jgi:xanthine dehydrogenase accessory factor|nr:XdhC family protein [Salinivirgaceae bacterium]
MNIYTFCHHHLAAGRNVALMVIIETKGSSPGKVGFKMAVTQNEVLYGSIGGGSAEYAAVEMAKKMHRDKQTVPILKRQVHTGKEEKDSSGMICSGEQTFAIVLLGANDLATVQALEKNVGVLRKGNLMLSEAGLEYHANEKSVCEASFKPQATNSWEYAEPVGLENAVCIFGGGHVSVDLSNLLNMLGFYVQVFDNRDDISTMKTNTFAHEKHVINFNDAGSYVPEGENVYVVIMTVGHMHDLQVLEQLVGKNVKYLGMMGSRSKVSTIHELLKTKGFAEKQISNIYMPIGEPIYSHTPKEIAVSISAEIIKVKNRP